VNSTHREDDLRSVGHQNAPLQAARRTAEEELLHTRNALRETQERLDAALATAEAATNESRAKEEQLRAIFNQAAVGIAVANLDGVFLDTNHKFCDILGYRPDELRSTTFIKITHPDDVEDTKEKVAQLLAGEIPEYSIEKRYLRPDRSIVWSLSTVTLLKDGSGRPYNFIGVIEDITHRKNVEEALRQETAHNAQLYEASQQAAEERRALLESERGGRRARPPMCEM
jgi:PAS domain S-box-containing protein